MNLQERIESSIIKTGDFDNNYISICFALHKELGFGYEDLMNMPIPYVIDMITHLQKHIDNEKKAARKRR